MQNQTIFQIVKGVFFALAVSLLCSVVFACILRFSPLPDTVIYPVNQTLKAVCIAVGTLLFVRGEKGLWKGGGIALIFTALSYLAFSAIGGDFSLSWLIFLELAIALIVGAAAGAVAVNLHSNG